MRARPRLFGTTVVLTLLAASGALAQAPIPPAETLLEAFPDRPRFSPYAGRNFPTQA